MKRLTVAIAGCLLVATSSVACGGADDAASTATTAPQPAAIAGQPAGQQRESGKGDAQTSSESDDERKAKRVVSGFYAILDAGAAKGEPGRAEIDTTSFCDLLSEQARQQTVDYAKVSSGIARKWDCESAVELLVLRAKGGAGFEEGQAVEVIGVNAQGDRATATVRFGDGPITSLPMVKEEGEWKLAASAVSPSG